MSTAAWEWFLTIIGTVASVFGVVFSWLAWIQAKKAKQAAAEAADAVRTRFLSQSVSRWAIDARELLKAVREAKFEDAQRAATDLLGVVSHNKGRQTAQQRTEPALEEIVSMLNLINAYLTDEAVFADKAASLTELSQTVYRRMNEFAGAIDAQAEKR